MNYSQRLDFFKNLISLEFLDDYYDKVKLFREENNKFLVQLEEKKNANKKIIEIIEENNDEYIIFLNDKIKEMRNEYSNLNKQLERLETTEEYDEKILEIEKDKSDINKSIKEIQNEINLINGNISICKKKINDANKEIKTLDDLSGINCPICKQPVSEEYVHDCSKIYKEIIDSNSELIIEYNKDIAKWNITKEKCDERINEFDKKIKEINNKKNEINMERSKIQGQINSVVKDGKKYKSELENLTNKDSDKNGKKSIYEMKDRCLTKAIETRNIWKTKSDFWYEMFAPKSALRTQILKKYVNVLSDMFEFYLSRLYNNEITGKILIDPDNGNIDIVLTKGNGDEISYFGLSSGERKRATIGIFLSLFEFYSYLNSQSPKFMILDEIFDSLDKPGVKLVVETIKEEIINRLNIDVFIISHIDVQEYLDDYTEIEVIKKDNISSASIKKKLN
jgi:DNA repair exonuclease SbcCD ATPase subunit